jgi:2',3'-cyclic-nucleotide 2'-phosphodiesterase (5'-nucleotidase family)
LSIKTIYALLVIITLSVSVLTQTASPTAAGQSETLDQKLGADDGAAFAILFGANMRGNFDLCDCNYPRGGLARRVGYVETFKKKFKQTPVIQVEAGFFLYDSTGYPPAVVLQNEQVARAYSRWPVDVINLGRFDLVFARKLLEREGYTERVAALTMINNLISANGVFDKDAVAPPAYVIKEVTGPRIRGKKDKIRVGFVGLAEPIKPAEGIDITVLNMFETARRVVPQARKESDLLIIVAHCELQNAVRLAQENPQADIVIAGNAASALRPRQVGNTLVVCAAPGNTQEGDIRVYINEDGRMSFKFLSIDLDAMVPSDPQAAAFAEAARLERNRLSPR